jgi:dTDP-4-dehydrorhamnose reductase
MKALIVGCNGQLGISLQEIAPVDVTVTGVDVPEIDITDESDVREVLRQERPSVVINAAAYTAVDQAESHADEAHAVNAVGVKNLALAAGHVGARLIQISTDFVFDGTAEEPYLPNATPNPKSVYGQTKLDGEQQALSVLPNQTVVIRTAWLYSQYGKNFVLTILRLLRERDSLSVVSDQVGGPTWANSLASAVWRFAQLPRLTGIYHWTDRGQASWHGFATAIQEEALALGLIETARPIKERRTEVSTGVAARPAYSVLNCSESYRAIGLEPPHWRENLRSMLQGMTD